MGKTVLLFRLAEAAIDQTPPRALGRFAFSDVNFVINILNEAGFKDSLYEVVRMALVFPGTAMDAATVAVEVGPATRIANDYSADQEDIRIIERSIAQKFEGFECNGELHIPAFVNLFSAAKVGCEY